MASNQPVVNQNKTIAALVEAYRLTYGLKWLILKRMIFALFIGVIILIPLMMLTKYTQSHYGLSDFLYHTMNFVVKIIAITFIIKIWVPVMIVGVRRSIGLPIDFHEIKLSCYIEKQSILKLSIIYALISGIFASLFLLFPGYSPAELTFKLVLQIIFLIALTPIMYFAFPLVITKNLTVSSALLSAYINISRNRANIAGPIVIMTIIFPSIMIFLSLITPHIPILLAGILQIIAFILEIWLIPMVATLGGILFRDTYGLKIKDSHAVKK